MSEPNQLDITSLREKLRAKTGKHYWRTLDELAESPQFEEMLHREFPENASEWHDPVSRRNFLKLMGASLTLAGLTSCGAPPTGVIAPYARAPHQIVPGEPLFFATAMPLSGSAIGLLVESHEGRPTKVEGNPGHPASLGATDVYAQASILGLYDPDRSQAVTYEGDIRTWSGLAAEISTQLEVIRQRRGKGLCFLTETVSSPTMAWQFQSLQKDLPEARWVQFEPLGRHCARAGAQLAFGRDVNTVYHFDRANVVLALDADFMAQGAGSVRYARDFMSRRRLAGDDREMNRLYAVECTPSCTGTSADHHFPVRASEIEAFARAIAASLGLGVAPSLPPHQAKWAEAIAKDLQRNKGAAVVVAGEGQPAAVHALAHAINQALGAVGTTVTYTEPVEAVSSDQFAAMRGLAQALDAGQVDWLVILGGNPVYDAPADLDFSNRIQKARWRMHLSLYQDETSALCQWHVNAAHYLESWGDARAFDGTATIIQPLIAPLYAGRTAHDVLAAFAGQAAASAHDLVRQYWKAQHTGTDFEEFWKKSLNDGVVAGTSLPAISVPPHPGWQNPSETTAKSFPADSLEIVFRADAGVYDGRFANNGWLQELPRPITKLTWDNAALISPATAEKLKLSYTIASTGGEHGQILADVMELEYRGQKFRAPAWIAPGQADDTVTLVFGYGRTSAGQVGTGIGYNANWFRTSDAPWFDAGLVARAVGGQQSMACTQFHSNMEGRELIRGASLEEFKQRPKFAQEAVEAPPPSLTLYPGFKYDSYAWGMSVDMNACTGCSACVVACQAENNIPVVGQDQVMRGREMHWLRIDRYYEGAPDNPGTFFQPVMCQQCENAPCEVVCPVGATVHSSEGLNDMVYNRCVGTRYCSNNCPYKVRRFNFLAYSDWDTPSLKLLRNPEVTVRSRGVMEKCTYCVQRISSARIAAEKENREIRDGEIRTACQAACPTQAIIFGNINDPRSSVARLKSAPRNYGLLAELNTNPRTSYLAVVRNPNPELEGAS